MQLLNCSLIDFTTVCIKTDSSDYLNQQNINVINGKKFISIEKTSIKDSCVYLKLTAEINIKYKTIIEYDNQKFNVNYYSLYSTKEFDDRYYTEKPLGIHYSKTQTIFKLWSPIAENVDLLIYDSANSVPSKFSMEETKNGVWQIKLSGDYNGFFYNYQVKIQGEENEIIDPYARACSINGIKGAILDFSLSNPKGFSKDSHIPLSNYSDAVLYEINVRDISIHPDSGIEKKGKFLGLCEENTSSSKNILTGLSHIKELGITHVQLMPVFDFSYQSVDEEHPYKYNWGYDPQNYNIPEGNYSTAPSNPLSRILELKQAVAAFHRNNIGVIMDVVYNHIFKYEYSNLHNLFPHYFFRECENGDISNGSGCGNDIASEHSMVRKFITDSLIYWMEEYHIDGFRFDLMGILDVDTVNYIISQLKSRNSDVIIYGEGWNMGTAIAECKRCSINNNRATKNLGFFNDVIRDSIKGSVFQENEKGFVSGKQNLESMIKYCAAGCCITVDDKSPIFDSPTQTINYISCHDNYTLWDKLKISCPGASENNLKAMCKLAYGILLTSQGIPLLHSGCEFCRTKSGISNSYNATDIINRIDWNLKYKNMDLFQYVKGLISIRRGHNAFREVSSEDIKDHLVFLPSPPNTVAYLLKDNGARDSWNDILIIYNSTSETQSISIPDGSWNIVANGKSAGLEVLEKIEGSMITVSPVSAIIAYKSN
ncbi:type I pullulanase [Clostridium oryzae]|uniref:Pullulanase n=1 Tax=Clostridium oryzae TaxID=1450648 RepID=A0A1V4IW61_9CLOT|nr:type I pullulanase [Clostridium oryzae]OPJ64186.1 pullulanase precursor [Clostridium oryzae]